MAARELAEMDAHVRVDVGVDAHVGVDTPHLDRLASGDGLALYGLAFV